MLTSKQRADLRAQANDLDTTLMVGKGGVTENVLSEAARQLEARELVKGRVLEAALLSAREVCDALCEALGADGVQCVGSKFVIYRRSEKKAQEAARQARELKKRKSNPVRRGAQERRRQARGPAADDDYVKLPFHLHTSPRVLPAMNISGRLPFRPPSSAGRAARNNINHRKGERRTWQISVYSAGASTRRIAAICWLQRSSSADLGWTASF